MSTLSYLLLLTRFLVNDIDTRGYSALIPGMDATPANPRLQL